MEKLEPTGELTVQVSALLDPMPHGAEASGGPEGVWIHARLIVTALQSGDDLRLEFILSEEIAHVILDRHGVGHDTETEQFFQELFATWFQLDHMRGRIPLNRLNTWPVDEEKLYYNAGKQLGAAMAGVAANRGHLDAWIAKQDPDANAVRLIKFAEARLTPPLSAEAVKAAADEWEGTSPTG